MVHYMFETDWELTAPIEQVFDVLSRPEDYQKWWPSVTRSLLVSKGGDDGAGAHARFTIRSPLLYSMTFDLKTIDVEKPSRIRSIVRGDLIGTGAYHLETSGQGTRVRFDWHVSTTKRWMNVVAVFARPLLAWTHHSVMRDGCAAMATHLNARLVSTSSKLVERPTPMPATAG